MVLLNSDRAPRTPPYSGARSKGGQSRFAYAAIMLYGGTFQCSSATCWFCNSPKRLPPLRTRSHDPRKATPAGLALCRFRLLRFRSPLLTQSNFFLFLRVLRWFTSLGLLLPPYFIQMVIHEFCSCGFPHSEICGSKDACSSPQLFAACHVLHRLEVPRHPPCALSSLTVKLTREQRLLRSLISRDLKAEI